VYDLTVDELDGQDALELLNLIADVVYVVDNEGYFAYVNPAGAELFGWTAGILMS